LKGNFNLTSYNNKCNLIVNQIEININLSSTSSTPSTPSKMSVYSLKKTQFIPISLDAAWDFFSHPKNLAVMTPEYLNLKFTNELYGEEMYPGQVMTYNVRPVLGIPMFWMTEITHVVPKKFFVDEQRFGPYAMWHHQHHFEEVEGGVMMTDLIHYKAPLGFLGDIAVALFIKKQLEGIFDFRKKKVEELFPSTY
jgi:ligand-binding SRPBCC domain-containing protein